MSSMLVIVLSCHKKHEVEENRLKLISSVDVFDQKEENSMPEVHASTLVMTGSKVLIAGFGGTKEGNDDVGIWLSERSADNQWKQARIIAKIREEAHWNPVLFYNERTVYLFFKVGKEISHWETWWMKSEDEGRTWDAPQPLVEGDQGGRGPVRNKIIILSDGSWVAGASTEYDSWSSFVDISKDEGKTWRRSENIKYEKAGFKGKGMIQPTLWESKPGNVHMLIRTTDGNIYRSDSDDYGETWNTAYKTDLPNPNSGIDVVKIKDMLILAYNPDSENWGARKDLTLAISKDNGKTWQDVYVVEKGKEGDEYSYPAIINLGTNLGLTYTANRENIKFKEFEIKPLNK